MQAFFHCCGTVPQATVPLRRNIISNPQNQSIKHLYGKSSNAANLSGIHIRLAV